jgi:adenosylcobinamide amidohydrolase
MLRKRLPWQFEGAVAEIIRHNFRDVPVKTLVISFTRQHRVLSSREGFKEVRAVGNSFNPPQLWDLIHQNWELYLSEIIVDLKLLPDEVAILSTGVDIDHCAFKVEEYEELNVSAFVTAGVESNAMRIGVDRASGIEREGKFEPVGTINTILLTNACLSESAMVRSLITVTEAKTIALQDMDIRSSYNPSVQATGTGTDQVIIVSGEGPGISYCGGHCKMGELMARAVTSATREAILERGKARSG